MPRTASAKNSLQSKYLQDYAQQALLAYALVLCYRGTIAGDALELITPTADHAARRTHVVEPASPCVAPAQVSAVKTQLGQVGGALRKVEAELHAAEAASDVAYLQLLADFHNDATAQLYAAQARHGFFLF